MSTSARDADQLVEEGLELYSAGRFDAALGKWRAALLSAPAHGRAIEYIDYVEGNREALEEAYAQNTAAARRTEKSDDALAPFGEDPGPPEEQSGPGSFFEVVSEPNRGGAAGAVEPAGELPIGDPDGERDVDPSEAPPARHRRHTQRSFAEPLEEAPPASDPFGADEPTPVSLIEEQEFASPALPAKSRPAGPTRDGLEPLPDDPPVEESPPESAPKLRKVPPRAAGPGMPRRRPVGVPPPLPRGVVSAPPEVGAMPPSQPMRASQPTPPLVGLDDLLTSDEAAALALSEGAAAEVGAAPAEDPQHEIVVEAAPPSQSYEDLARKFIDDSGARVDTMLKGARELYDQGTYEGSLWLCQKILGLEPDHVETLGLLGRNQEILLKNYEEHLGDLQRVPTVRVSQGDIVWHKLDHRAGFLISRIDGMLSYDDILDISGMERFEAMRILAQLVEQGVVDIIP